VAVALGYHLRDEDGVGAEGARAGDELVVLDLGAEVVGVEALVALEAFFPGEALVVEDGVDADGVRVASMPTVWASLPVQAPTTTILRPSFLAVASISSRVRGCAASSSTWMSARSTV
jgi:hypothetical protein